MLCAAFEPGEGRAIILSGERVISWLRPEPVRLPLGLSGRGLDVRF